MNSGAPKLLESYRLARGRVDHAFRDLVKAIQDDPTRIAHQKALAVLHQQSVDYSAGTVEALRSGASEMAMEMMAGGEGERLLHKLRTAIDQVVAEEQWLLTVRSEEERLHAWRMNWTLFASFFIALAVAVFTARAMHRDMGERSSRRRRCARASRAFPRH